MTKNCVIAVVVLLASPSAFWAQGVVAKYAVAAPLSEYIMVKDAEVALARSAAPVAISGGAEVLQRLIFRSSGMRRFAGRFA
jgi:hypothetical protein